MSQDLDELSMQLNENIRNMMFNLITTGDSVLVNGDANH